MAATPYKPMEMLKKDKKGNWIVTRASEVEAKYQSLKSHTSSDTEMTTDEFQFYLQASVPSYAPNLVAQYALENALLKEQLSKLKMDREADRLGLEMDRLEANRLELERQREVMDRIEAFLAEKCGWSLGPTCSSGPRPGPKDDFTDEGPGCGSQHVVPLG